MLRILQTSIGLVSKSVQNVLPLNSIALRTFSSKVYDPYPEFETPSPYRKPNVKRYGYKVDFWTGGLLPRSDGKDVKPLPGSEYKPKDNWSEQNALFGQNDYIDILGEGSINPKHLIRAPRWLVGYAGNEYKRAIRQMKFEGSYLEEYQPRKYHDMRKRIKYLYKRYNRRRKRVTKDT